MNSHTRLPTIAGIFSIIFWSSTVGISRKAALDIGAVRSGFYIFLLGGILGFLITTFRGRLYNLLCLNKKYLIICGTLFVFYMISLYLAIGFAKNSAAVIEVGIINYFWPALTLLLSVPILKNRLKLIIIPGIITASAGILLATAGNNLDSLSGILTRFSENMAAYILALTAAVSWALYSNFCRSLSKDNDGDASPLFMVFTALAFLLLSCFFDEQSSWTQDTYKNLIYLIIFPTFLAYQFWEISMKKGDMMLITVISYLTPVLSTIATSIILDILPGWHLWFGCILVITGAFLSKKGIVEREVSG